MLLAHRKTDLASTPTDLTEDIDLGILKDLAGYHLRRASGAFAADFARSLSGTGVRQVLFGIMSVVAANPGINQGNVGRGLGIQRANMVSLINELVDMHLLERKVSSDDRRAFSLTLLPLGQEKLTACLARIHEHEEAMLSGLTVTERKRLLELLSKVEAREV
jgi:DNA-binding MarR family transcriptional regulator